MVPLSSPRVRGCLSRSRAHGRRGYAGSSKPVRSQYLIRLLTAQAAAYPHSGPRLRGAPVSNGWPGQLSVSALRMRMGCLPLMVRLVRLPGFDGALAKAEGTTRRRRQPSLSTGARGESVVWRLQIRGTPNRHHPQLWIEAGFFRDGWRRGSRPQSETGTELTDALAALLAVSLHAASHRPLESEAEPSGTCWEPVAHALANTDAPQH